MIRAMYISREDFDVRSNGDHRTKCDRYVVSYQCPPDKNNPDGPWEWRCAFEVPRGTPFAMKDYPDTKTARLAQGYSI